MHIWSAAYHARKPVLFLVAVLALLGVRSYLNAPQSIFPAISFSRVEVFAYAGDLPPEAMKNAVTQPLEAALRPLSGLEHIRSYTNQGAVEIELDFDPHGDARTDLQNVDAVLARSRDLVPPSPRIESLIENPNMEPVGSHAFV